MCCNELWFFLCQCVLFHTEAFYADLRDLLEGLLEITLFILCTILIPITQPLFRLKAFSGMMNTIMLEGVILCRRN